MLPVVAGTQGNTPADLLYTLLLVPVSLTPWAIGFSGTLYGVAAVLLGAEFVVSAWKVLRDRQDAAGLSLYRRCAGKSRVQILHHLPVRAVRGAGGRSPGGLSCRW